MGRWEGEGLKEKEKEVNGERRRGGLKEKEEIKWGEEKGGFKEEGRD